MSEINLDFKAAWQELKEFEAVNGIDSAEFYQSYLNGDADVNPLAMHWVTVYELFLEMAPAVNAEDHDRRVMLTA